MKRPTLFRLALVLLLAVVVAAALAVVATRGGPAPSADPPVNSGPGGPTTALRELSADQAGRAFLAGYVDPDGRVVRRDQGDDTVSEGQAYAMLVAVGIGDRATFAAVWAWTKTHLRRADGTLAWRWQEGQVVDASSASDADLDAARALVVAGRVFDDEQLTTEGVALGQAILDTETVSTELGRILVAGTWATQDPYAYNPSYASPVAFAVLAQADPDRRWAQLANGSRAVTRAMLDRIDLPPDWAQVHGDGAIEPMPGAAGRGNDGVRYSYDAARMPIRYAESCAPEDVALATRLSEPLARFGGNPAARDLGGQPLTTDESVVAITAQAAVAAGSGIFDRAATQLLAADHLQQQHPTYYGGAWNALGRLLLTNDVLGGCPPMAR